LTSWRCRQQNDEVEVERKSKQCHETSTLFAMYYHIKARI
jgi:hypothetical protein